MTNPEIDAPKNRKPRSWLTAVAAVCVCLVTAAPSLAFEVGELSETQKQALDKNFDTILRKTKGPYTPNYCVCKDGKKLPVMDKKGRIANRCGTPNTRFCAAFRAEWAEALAAERM